MFNLLIILFTLACNGILAAYELAITSVRLDKLRIAEKQKKKGARDALYMKENIEGTLSAIQLGITFCGIIAGAVGGAGPSEQLKPFFTDTLHLGSSLAALLALSLTVIPIGAFSIIFGELIPKVFALRNNIAICLLFSPWIKKFSDLVYPFANFFEFAVTKIIHLIDRLRGRKHSSENGNEELSLKELRIFASISRKAKLISRQEERIIVGATKLSSRPIRDIMVPLADTVMLSLDKTVNENLIVAQSEAHKRYPILKKENDPKSVQGYINLKEFFFFTKSNPCAASLAPIIRPLTTIKYNTSIADVLEKIIEDRAHLLMLTDHRNKTVGIVTLEDIMEELVGDIQNEFDRLPHFIKRRGNSWYVGSGITIKHLVKATKIFPFTKLDKNIEPKWTLAQYIDNQAKRTPRRGESYRLQSISLTVQKVKRFKAHELIACPLHPASKQPTASKQVKKIRL